MYITKKKISGKEYYYLNKSIRMGDKVISKHIAYLGGDKQEAERKAEEIKEKLKKNPSIDNIKNKKCCDNGMETKQPQKPLTIEELANFCKEKGFVFRSSDIYGGYSGFWDFGPLGIELFNNIRQHCVHLK